MDTPIDYPKRLDAIRTAYKALPEEIKRDICATFCRLRPKSFAHWSQAAATGYRNHIAESKRPPGVGGKLDDILLKSEASEFLLRKVFPAFFCERYPEWVEAVGRQLRSETRESVDSRLEEVLAQPSLPFRGNVLESLFLAASRRNPVDWLGTEEAQEHLDAEDGGALDETGAVSESLSPPSGEAVAPSATDLAITDLNTSLVAVENALAQARVAMDFDLAGTIAGLEKAASAGACLRKGLEHAAQEASEPVPPWTTVAELKRQTERLRETAQRNELAKSLRTRLESLRDTLQALVDIGSRTANKKRAVDASRQMAVTELGERIATPEPPAVPGEGSGPDWFKTLFGLDAAAFDKRLEQLRTATLPALATFIEEAETWERFRVVPQEISAPVGAPSAAQASPPVAADSPGAVPRLPDRPDMANLPAEIVPAPGSQPPQHESKGVIVSAGCETASVDRSAPLKQPNGPPVTAAPPIQPAARNDAAEVNLAAPHGEIVPQIKGAPTPASHVSKAGERRPAAEQPTVEREPACAGTLLAFDGLTDIRVLLPDVVACQDAEDQRRLPPVEIWEILVLQPWLDRLESDDAERIRSLLVKVTESGWAPNSELEAQLTWAAAIVPAFMGMTTQAFGLLSELSRAPLPSHLAEFIRATLRFFGEVSYCTPEHIRGGALQAAWKEALGRYQADLLRFCDLVPARTINFQKATVVWQRLNGRGGRLRAIAERAQRVADAAALGQLQPDLDELENPRKRDKLIERTARDALAEHYDYIEGAAREQLSKHICEFIDLLRRYCNHVKARPQEARFVEQKVAAFRQSALPILRRFQNEPVIGYVPPLVTLARQHARSAAQAILTLFESGREDAPGRIAFSEARHLARLRIKGLRVDPRSGEIQPSQDVERRRILLRSDAVMSIDDAFSSRLAAHDIGNARFLLSALPPTPNRSQMLEDARAMSAERSQQQLHHARRDVINARTLSVISDSEAQQRLTKLTAAQRTIEESEDFETALAEIEEIRADLRAKSRSESDKLAAELKEIGVKPPELNARISKLLDAGDLATAREYIERIKANHPLPPLLVEEEIGGGFTAKVEEAIAAAFRSDNEFPGFVAKVRGKGRVAGCDFSAFSAETHRELIDWLDAWQQMGLPTGLNEAVLKRWLIGLQFVPRTVRVSEAGAIQTADVEAEPIADRNVCGVPAFGSEANGRYRIVRVAQRQDPAQLLSHLITHGNGAPAILLLGYRLDRQVRLEFARLCRDKRVRGILVDEILMAFLAGFQRDRLSRFFRSTLPFSWVNPFLPTSSYVPPELFFGRHEALESLVDPMQQRCFVYGGRQLGKTALLREVARRFHRPSAGAFAIWIDLQAEQFGRESEPEEIWARLGRRLRNDLEGFEEAWKETRPTQTGRQTESALLRWLRGDERRRLLLLLDEADRFLDRDAVRDFSETRRLKGLMDRTQRRMKVVFAGLHNVQRTTQQANHPLAHLGSAINVGAFSENGEWMEAYALIVSPLAALGYTFESVDLPSRVLTACNFYPCLLQQFGHRLLERMRQHSALRELPYLVRASDVDAIVRQDEFRQFMIERFRWTLQLDRRYHYLAYGYAWLFQEEPDQAAKGFTSAELRAKMEEYRPNEFARLTRDEFETLLDEMRGLGIFQRGEGETCYRLRNTNVLLLLGEPGDVMNRLIEDVPDLRLDYQSATYRGKVMRNRRRWLTRPEENRLFERVNQVTLICGAPLAASASLSQSLLSEAGQQFFQTLHAESPADLEGQLANLGEEKLPEGTHIVLVEPAGDRFGDEWLRVGLDFAERRTTKRFFSLVFKPPLEIIWDADGQRWLESEKLRWAFARRWENAFIGPWLQEQNFVVPMDGMTELRNTTDGWPGFLHEFAKALAEKSSWAEALDATRTNVRLRFAEAGCRSGFVGEGTGADGAWKDFQALLDVAPDGFDGADLTAFADLRDLPPALAEHRVNFACKLDLIERQQTRYSWTKLFARALAVR